MRTTSRNRSALFAYTVAFLSFGFGLAAVGLEKGSGPIPPSEPDPEIEIEAATPSFPSGTREVSGGNWLRGERLFFNEGGCSHCHAIRGEGGALGPNLSNLPLRDSESLVRDILRPSSSIHPDYVFFAVETKDGGVYSGVLRSASGGDLALFNAEGEETQIEPDRILEIRPSAVSVMPEGVEKKLGPEQVEDLLAYLLVEPPSMPVEIPGRPAPRSRKEVADVLRAGGKVAAATRPLRVILLAGPKDHGPGEHDYPNWQSGWKRLLSLAEGVEVTTAWGWPENDDFESADVIVAYFMNDAWRLAKSEQLGTYLERGGGLVLLHSAIIPKSDPLELARQIGLAWKHGVTKWRHGPLTLKFRSDGDHPITRGYSSLDFVDESYWPLMGDRSEVDVLATGEEEGKPRPLLWTYRKEKGRVFGSILGHYSWTFDDPLFRVLILRGIAWSAGEPADRFSGLATVGVRFESSPPSP